MNEKRISSNSYLITRSYTKFVWEHTYSKNLDNFEYIDWARDFSIWSENKGMWRGIECQAMLDGYSQ